MMTILLHLLALYFGSLPLYAQTTGVTNLLSRGPGAEAAALGDTTVSTVHDPTALYWNPAGLAYAGGAVTGEHLFLYDGARYDFLGFSIPSFLGTFGLGALQLNRDNIIARSAVDDPGYKVSNTQSDYMAGFSRRLGEHWAIGGTGNILDFNVAGYRGMGFGMDVGAQAAYLGGDFGLLRKTLWSFGGLLKNIVEPAIKLNVDQERLPRELRGGANLSFDSFSRAFVKSGEIQHDRTALSVSFKKTAALPGVKLGLGLSYAFNNILVLRAGYNDGVSGGFGFNTFDHRLTFDYALESRPFSNNHHFTLTYRFSAPQMAAGTPAAVERDDDYLTAKNRAEALSDDYFAKGKALFDAKSYGEALEPLALAAVLYPDDHGRRRFFERALEVHRRDKIDALSKTMQEKIAAGRNAEALSALAKLLTYNPDNRSELAQTAQTLKKKISDGDFSKVAEAVFEDRKKTALNLQGSGWLADALKSETDLDVFKSSRTAASVVQLKNWLPNLTVIPLTTACDWRFP